ncbi:MAG: acetyl-CoA carboxylase biotin carboxylase subunit [Calditrichaeota bacterium]|nr:MAG: acetyl-CoA carboxylase biotin carboxylase subunit [Calditrichota bacterium]
MTKKLLIANRGEIAVRIIRTCREMGIHTVAVYSDVDRLSPHVLMAEEAYHIGPPPSTESYLLGEKLIEIALQSGCQAIHPGYGFLSENADFARAVMEAGLIFIGPRPETIELMGSKTASRKTMIDAGVPVVPGSKEAVQSLSQAEEIIASLGGYPILLKAAAGGGGKGMRVVKTASELSRALEAAKGEALKAFGDDTVYIEKFVENPKHIEFQILADQHGNVIHLWERDCSIQRRHQKVIEECPSKILTPEKRMEMGEIARKAAQACGYVNAGTVEFLYDSDGSFYFLEMNTRLQVEHPVTEMVMGVDLVQLQIKIAQNDPLPLQQDDIHPRGHALECRINAEDVFNNFVPSTGKITNLQHPEGPGIRVDSGIEAHSEITRYYDPMFAKLIVWAPSREDALQKMLRALMEFRITGVQTTIPFCLSVLTHPEFRKGEFTTRFVDLYWDELKESFMDEKEILDVLAAALACYRDTTRKFQTTTPQDGAAKSISPWKLRALPR